MTIRAYAFDAYGTLFDVHAAIRRHAAEIGPDADQLSALWRAKQLEYSWTRTLMGRYRDFWELTKDALDFALARHPAVDRGVRGRLLDAYRTLDAYPDVIPALSRLKRAGCAVALFTNGTRGMAEAAAAAAGVLPLLDDIVSVDEIARFKTAPEVYANLCARLAAAPAQTCLVSSNRWDIAGGRAFGLATAWINRTGQPDEYPDLPPDGVLPDLSALGATAA